MKGSPEGKVQRGQYVLAVDLGCYRTITCSVSTMAGLDRWSYEKFNGFLLFIFGRIFSHPFFI